jgi:FtsP/CotA-like multicopper oxidase with cupredoxin domain
MIVETLRDFGVGGALLLMLSITTVPGIGAENSLRIPSVLNGPVYNLDMQTGTTQLLDTGLPTRTAGYNGSILGPTLIMNSGDFVTLNVHNSLQETTTTHWHGMHVTASDDGGPYTVINPGATWSPDFTVLDSASTMWYHPHLHGKTHEQVNSGLAGMILVRDEVEAAAGLPRTYGVDEFPLILQDRSFGAGNTLRVVPLGDVMMVNGTLDPYLEVPGQLVRFRVLNGSNERAYYVGVSDNRTFHVVGTEGGLLEAPTPVKRVLLMPGERADVVVDFTADIGDTLSLRSYASELRDGIPGAARGPGGADNPLNGLDLELVQLRVGAAVEPVLTRLPTSIWTIEKPAEADVTARRTIRMTGGVPGTPFTLDNQEYAHDRIDQTVFLGAVEIWTIENNTGAAHPFHIHDIQFFILDRNGVPPAAHESGKKDTVLVDARETVRFITRFETHAETDVPYMYHCHILPHEDGGMMGQFIVVDLGSQLLDFSVESTDLTLRWSGNLGALKLQSATEIGSFNDVQSSPAVVNGMFQVDWTRDTEARFFRLIGR